uniref:4-amino-4-deoxy-L-arabinose transferase n=1 Tax=Candidatus Kentrum sp. SD TaxID=2126332 RepID=A0A450Z2J4_9GAMM|nr:MAG: hypothetical protein BECKSD772F_GA0070984_11132 [Candidatus Kentron sp. SD]VFK47969.1 MAG: hypothetical protein BECKSD772E_GA0070983_11102 [Candidatus Kentron sp. SD]
MYNQNNSLLPLTHLTPSGLAALFTLATVLVSWVVLYLPWESVISAEMYLPEYRPADTHDSAGQRMAHRVALGMIAIFSLIGIYLGRKNRLHYPGPVGRGLARGFDYLREHAWIGIVLIVIFTGMDAYREGGTLSNIVKASKLTYIAAGVLILWLLPTITERVTPLMRRLLWVAFLFYCLYLLLTGLIVTPNRAWMSPEDFSFSIHHHAAVTYPTLFFAQEGMRVFDNFNSAYGVLMPALAAMAQKLLGAFSFGDFLHLVQLLQVAFFLMMVAAHRILLPGRSLALVGVIFLMLPWLGSFSPAIGFPNVSAWRFLGIAVTPLLLVSVRHLSMGRSAVTLGFGSGILLLINLETALCLSAGMLVYLVVRMNPFSWGGLLRMAALFAVGFFMIAVSFALLFRTGMGYWPSPPPVGALLSSVVTYSRGLIGCPFYWEPLGIVIFIHTTFIVIRSAMTWRMRTLPFRSAFKLAIATIILSWFAYYANCPGGKWYLWTYIVLYLFLIPGYVSSERLRRWKQRWKLGQWRATPVAAAVLILILMPTALRTNLHGVNRVSRDLPISTQSSAAEARKISGIWLAREIAVGLEEKGAYVRSLAPSEDFLMFTDKTFMISLLSGHVPRFPSGTFFYSTPQYANLDGLILGILARAPKKILFDADILYPHDPGRGRDKRFVFREQALLHRLQNRLKDRYRSMGIVSGWEVWVHMNP